jgi:glycosyltransferase involved in cell wall biosynthesis
MNDKSRLKVYFAWNYFEWGGAQIYFLGLIRRIREFAEIEVVLPQGSDVQLVRFIQNIGVTCNFFEVSNYDKSARTFNEKIRLHIAKFKAESSMIRYLLKQDLRESVVHVELAPWQSLYWLIKLCVRTNVFITMHNSLPPVPGWRYALWKFKFGIITRFKRFSIFASNEDAKLSLKPLVNTDFYERIKVTFTNVNPEEVEEALNFVIDRHGLLTKFGIPDNKFLVFCVGQFIDRKGRWTFLEAAKKVKANDKEVAFVWISNSKPSDDDLEKVKSYSLGDDFVFIVSDQVGAEHVDLFKLIRIADVYALISVQEGLPISLLEAMALGIPSISTNVNAIPEAIKHLETGMLIESGNVDSLVSAINLLKSDSKLRAKLSENGRKLVVERFNEIEVAKIALKQYQDSCKRN